MARKNVTIPKRYKGTEAVFLTPEEKKYVLNRYHPKGASQPAKGPGGLLMMQPNGGGEEERDRSFAKKHGLTLAAVEAAGGSTMRHSKLASLKAAAAPAPAPAPAPASGGGAPSPAPAPSPAASGGGGSPAAFVRTRMGYDPDTSVDYTSTNPAYWASAVSYFSAHPEGNPSTGELGIWIPNLEKEGAERTALAAVAGGVTAHVDSNYSNRTVDDAKAKALHAARGDAAGAAGSYRGGAEKAIRLAGTHRGGTEIDTGYAMGSTAPSEHGVYLKGGVVVKGAGTDYVAGGGDFGGLLSRGDAITGDWLDSVLGARDKDGLRIRGTYPAVAGATGSGVAAGGTATGMGTFYGGGADPLASMPGVADYTAYMDPNSVFGGRSGNAAVRSGLLYQPMASDYGAKMAAAGMPAFSPTSGLLGSPGVGGVSAGGVGPPTYGAAPSGFLAPATAAAGGGVAGSAGLRDGLTAGRHSAHLGAYESSPGVWVWGDMPGAYGDAGSLGPTGAAASMADYMGTGPLGKSSPGYGSDYGVAGHPDAMSAAGPLGALGIDWGE
jgi:hypothetical protein